jgi:quercetin dioxygenase-like cupin family protein
VVRYEPHSGEEGLYILAGEIEVLLGERRIQAGVGDVIRYPADREHGFRNLGPGPAHILLISTKRVGKDRSSSGTTGRLF